MPIYEYQCTTCGYQTEVLQSINDLPLTNCATCNKPTLTKIISATGFHLSGSGWYMTDYKDKKPEAPSTPAKTDNTPTEKSDSQTTNTKKTEKTTTDNKES